MSTLPRLDVDFLAPRTQRRLLARSLLVNRVLFVLCSLAAMAAAARGMPIAALLMAACVVMTGIAMAKTIETEWLATIVDWEHTLRAWEARR